MFQYLTSMMAGMTARDAGIFLGLLAARYFRTCPIALYEAWVRHKHENRFASRFCIGTMQSELVKTIYF